MPPLAHLGRVAVLAVAAVLVLGTSKVLSGKALAGQVIAVPPGIASVSGPSLRLWENVNNQGCFAAQRLDAEVTVRVRNGPGAPLRPRAAQAGLTIDGRAFPVTSLRIQTLDDQGRPQASRPDLPPDATGDLILVSPAILPKRALSEVDRIEAWVDVPGGRLRVEVPGLRAVPVRSGR
jgi:hypothetical protein